jgi:hypothetical protein
MVKLGRPIFLRGDRIHTSASQSLCNRCVNMMIHEHRQAQGRRPMAFSLRLTDDSPRLTLICSTSQSCSSIPWSISA